MMQITLHHFFFTFNFALFNRKNHFHTYRRGPQ